MHKMHLSARVPSEGARLVAQWVADKHRGDLSAAGQAAWTTGTMIQRVVDGEITPGLQLGAVLHRACGVKARDFNRPARAAWFAVADVQVAA